MPALIAPKCNDKQQFFPVEGQIPRIYVSRKWVHLPLLPVVYSGQVAWVQLPDIARKSRIEVNFYNILVFVLRT